MPTIHIVGSVNQDIVLRASRAPSAGETVFGHSVDLFPGGKGANQAVAARRFFKNVTLTGCVGNDYFGEGLIAFLKGCDLQLDVHRVDACTGTALIQVDDTGENRITVVPGANACMGQRVMSRMNMTNADIVVLQNEIPFPTTKMVLRRAKEQGAKTVLNLAPVTNLDDETFSLIDLLVVNESEFTYLFCTEGKPDASAVLNAHRQRGCDIILTLGERGVLSAIEGSTTKSDGYKMEAIDTTGAGDCFVGALAARIAAGHSYEKAVAFANAAAALSVRHSGACSSFPDEADVVDFLLRNS